MLLNLGGLGKLRDRGAYMLGKLGQLKQERTAKELVSETSVPGKLVSQERTAKEPILVLACVLCKSHALFGYLSGLLIRNLGIPTGGN